MKRILQLLLAAGVWMHVCPAFAEETTTGLRIRALGMGLQKTIPKEAYAHFVPLDKEKPVIKIDIKCYLNHQFNLIPSGTRKMVWTESPDPANVGNKDLVLATVNVPAGMSSGIFLVLPTGASEKGRFSVLPIADSSDAFPAGSLKLMNISQLDVRVKLEKKAYEIKAGETRVIENMPVGANNSAGMKAFCLKEGNWQRIGSGVWPSPGKKRVLQLFFVNPATGQLEMQGFLDIAVR